MYHFQNHDIYHPNPYQQNCQLFAEHSKAPTLLATQNNHFEAVTTVPHTTVTLEAPPEAPSLAPARPAVGNNTVVRNKSSVDTSTFSIEERLVAAVWVHERKHTKSSMSQIKHDFKKRFSRDPPAKNTLLAWERKLFSSGSVHDAPRPGRPVNRSARTEEVAASVRAAPTLSLRARARLLRLPRTTLRTILCRDLHTRGGQQCAAAGKPQIKRNVKRQLKRKLESQGEPGAGAAPRGGHT